MFSQNGGLMVIYHGTLVKNHQQKQIQALVFPILTKLIIADLDHPSSI